MTNHLFTCNDRIIQVRLRPLDFAHLFAESVEHLVGDVNLRCKEVTFPDVHRFGQITVF
jgi:hypothetical protein